MKEYFNVNLILSSKINPNITIQLQVHCVKSDKIRSFFWSAFSCIRTEHRVDIHIQSEYRKIRTRKTTYLDGSRSGALNYQIDSLYPFKTNHLNVLQINCLVTMIILLATRNDKI